MFDSQRMARQLHTKLMQDTGEIQQKLVLQKLVNDAFADPLPVDGLRMMAGPSPLANARDTIDRMTKLWENRVKENTATIKELEALFVEQENADMDSFAKAMAERFKRGAK